MKKTIRKRWKSLRRGSGDALIGMYLKDVTRIPLLSIAEERELGRRIRLGDPVALQKMIESNLRFVIKVARKYAKRADQLMDLVNVGNIGLIEAARRFDPEMNVRFTSYAVWWIHQAIFQHLAAMSFAFRVPPKVANTLYRIARVLNQSSVGMQELRDREQLARKVGVSIEHLNSALNAIAGTVSLDQPIDEEGEIQLSDIIEQKSVPSPEKQAQTQSLRRALERSIQRLNPFEQIVIRLRFGLDDEPPLRLQQVGDRFNRSRERIRQIEKIALKKLHDVSSTQALNHYLT